MASAPLRPRSARALTTAAAMAATATAQLTLLPPALAAEAETGPARTSAAEARPTPIPASAAEGGPALTPQSATATPPLLAAPPPLLTGTPPLLTPAPPLLAPAAEAPPAQVPALAPTPALAPRAPAPDPPTPLCGTAPGGGFPLDTELHGGPVDYAAGGPPQEWRLDLTNRTDASCSGIHPVLVLTDRERTLRPEQIRFEFYDDGAARWRPVAFEATEEAENVGAFTGFGGFAVPAGKTLTVPVRLAFDAGTAPDDVVVNAAVVQRRGTDGDWVGESGDYRLTVGPSDSEAPAAEPTAPGTPAPSRSPGTASRPPAPTAAPRDPTVDPGDPTVDPRDPTADPRDPTVDPTAPSARPPDPELAHTGREDTEAYARALAPLAGALVLLGAVLVRFRRHWHRHR
ncbi:hypothetical protein ABZ567_04820 [Streptomyces sp. NPDC016459]|uniref:hypothetical protein n=1 Tax=Streptomyces sp. NPDC016459 TaxID=3157190 RepID=UPI0033C09918